MNRLPARRVAAAALAATLLLTGCSATSSGSASSGSPSSGSAASPATQPVALTTPSDGVFDPTQVHSIAVEVDPAEYEAMIAAYQGTGDKEWVHAAVTIDGTRFDDVGLRLKGNLTLRSVTAQTDPAEVPFLIKLDEFVDGQDLDGYDQFAVRAATYATALNEAVALDLLEQAGLATEHAVATRFSVNGGDEQLRLVVQNPDNTWDEENFDTDGILYKAEAGGDYSYRGTDPASYDDVFDQESDTKNPNLTPLIEFLEFLNNSSDAEFAAKLSEHLDVDAFARYIAFEALIGNDDDIEGGGNNSYLRWDADSGRMTVVAWDHNSALGGGMGPGGRDGGQMQGGQMGGRVGAPDRGGAMDQASGDGGRGLGGSSRTNILLQRFQAVPEFAALVAAASTELRQQLYSSGAAHDILDEWASLLTDQASDLVPAATIASDAAAIGAYFD